MSMEHNPRPNESMPTQPSVARQLLFCALIVIIFFLIVAATIMLIQLIIFDEPTGGRMPIPHQSRRNERPVIRLQRPSHLEPPSPIMQTPSTSYLQTSSLDRNSARHDSFYKSMNRAESLDSIDMPPIFRLEVMSLKPKTSQSCNDNLMMSTDIQQRNQDFPRQLSITSNAKSFVLEIEIPPPTDRRPFRCNDWFYSKKLSCRIAMIAVPIVVVSGVVVGAIFYATKY